MKLLSILFLILVIDKVWGADPKVIIKQTFPDTVYRNNHKTIIVEKDGDCFLACVVDNKPADKKVQWLVQNFETDTIIPISDDTDTQDAYKYQIDKPAANNWRLKIQNVQQTDQALFICRVQLGGQQNANDSRMIHVIQLPRIIDIFTSSDTTVEKGRRVELQCAASGIPTPVVTWQLTGGGILPSGGREMTAPQIVIESADRAHKGDYKCIALNVAGRDVRHIYLNVKFEPQLSPEATEVYQAIGYDKELTCEASGNPAPTDAQVMWFKDGVPLEDRNKYIFQNYIGSNYVLMKLTIKDLNENDYGSYRCYAENSEGTGQSAVLLSRSEFFVSDKPYSGGGSLLTFSITTIVMLVVTAILHCC